MTLDEEMRTLVRHQWVREHGAPRITTLAGRPQAGRALWHDWLRLSGRAPAPHSLLEVPTRGDEAWLARTAARAAARAVNAPREPIAIAVDAALVDRWLAARGDRLGALVSEGLVRIARPRQAPRARARVPDPRARSLAELTLFEALEATPATAGRFQLNQCVSFHFGSRAAEVDLLSRRDDIAVEVDGFHHFGDVERYRRDRRKDLLLQAHGYTVLRVLADDVLADPRDAVRMVVELLGKRRRHEKLRGS